jgi:hypothetical protein
MTGPRLFPSRLWTPEEDKELRSKLMAGRPTAEIAIKLKRTIGAVHSRARLLGLSFRRVKVRK